MHRRVNCRLHNCAWEVGPLPQEGREGGKEEVGQSGGGTELRTETLREAILQLRGKEDTVPDSDEGKNHTQASVFSF